jgi:SAM-dependent methyltransferase
MAQSSSRKDMRLFQKKTWPRWTDQTQFRTPNFAFQTQTTDYSKRSSVDVVQLLKPRSFLESYDRFAKDAKRILEIGFFQGGMPLYLADTTKAEKIVAIDLSPVPTPIDHLIFSKGLSNRVSMHGCVNQADSDRLKEILSFEFGDKPLDVITDDASHLYAPTKKSFETCFSYLNPGGVFIIEDWGWSHWDKGNFVRSTKFFSSEATPLSQLIFEIILTQCSQRGYIEKIEIVTGSMIVITRGEKLKHGEYFALDEFAGTWPIGFGERL